MPRPKKEHKNLNVKLALNTYESLERFCKETGISKTVPTEKILDKFFDEYFKKSKEERDLFG
jgi:ASC-1-like (ASCH) protein